jgi:hypothetical protein
MFLVKVSRTSAALSEIKREAGPFILAEDICPAFQFDTPFLVSQDIEKKKLKNADFSIISNDPPVPDGKKPDPKIQCEKTRISSDGIKNSKASKSSRLENINIAHVTRELINFVMKMPEDEKIRLFKKKTCNSETGTVQDQHVNVTKHLVDFIMNMSIDERCGFLGELKTQQGITRRESAREGYVTPVYFAVKGLLLSGYTRNISAGGLLIETLKAMGRKFFLGDPVTINFTHPRDRREIKIHGKIVRVGRSAIAVCFDRRI